MTKAGAKRRPFLLPLVHCTLVFGAAKIDDDDDEKRATVDGDASVAELVDALDLDSSGETRGGSSPPARTTYTSTAGGRIHVDIRALGNTPRSRIHALWVK